MTNQERLKEIIIKQGGQYYNNDKLWLVEPQRLVKAIMSSGIFTIQLPERKEYFPDTVSNLISQSHNQVIDDVIKMNPEKIMIYPSSDSKSTKTNR